MLEFLLIFAVIMALALFSGSFFTKAREAMKTHHESAVQKIAAPAESVSAVGGP